MIELPAPEDAIAAARLSELMSAEEMTHHALFSPQRHVVSDRPLDVVVLLASEDADSAPNEAMVGYISSLVQSGASVRVVSHASEPPWSWHGASFCHVPFAEPLEDAIGECDVIVTCHWEFILLARKSGIAPVVHLELGLAPLFDELPPRVHEFARSSLSSAQLVLCPNDEVIARLADRFAITARTCADLSELAELLSGGDSAELESQSRPSFVVDLASHRFARAGDEEIFRARLMSSHADAIALPISMPAWRGHRVLRWQVIARRSPSVVETEHIYLPLISDEPARDLPYQAGLEFLRAGQRDEALYFFLAHCRQASLAEQVILGRWLVLALLEAGRARDAADLAAAFARDYPAHADYLYLAIVARRAAGELFDIAAPLAALTLLGEACRYGEWFEAPVALLSEQLRAA